MFKLPDISLKHLRNLTDETGIIQHAVYSVPNRKTGYCLDDNARSLIAVAMRYEQFYEPAVLDLLNIYLSFLHYTQKEDGKFHNFVDYKRVFLDDEGSQDSFGRALWACGYIASASFLHNQIRAPAEELFELALNQIAHLTALRAQAFAILGLYYYSQAYPEKAILGQLVVTLADRLVAAYNNSASEHWDWFEDRLTYCNGRLPQAMYLAYDLAQDEKYLEVAEKTLAFLSEVLIRDNRLSLVGNQGWYFKGGRPALFDQQPVDAAGMVEVYNTAYQITGKRVYLYRAVLAFEWFTGRNVLGSPVYDPLTGACYDGLTPIGVNRNQGAESIVCYLLANLTLRKVLQSSESTSDILRMPN